MRFTYNLERSPSVCRQLHVALFLYLNLGYKFTCSILYLANIASASEATALWRSTNVIISYIGLVSDLPPSLLWSQFGYELRLE